MIDAAHTHRLQHGRPPVYRATVRITPGGTIHLRRGRWTATTG
ncbi:hypothetical protein [Streptosporangium sp. NPDC004631]